MRKVDKNVIIITLITIIFSLFLMKHLIGYKFTIEDTIGPGIYPLTILILIILVSIIITVKAFAQPEYKIISPYAPGSVKGVLIKSIADILSKELRSPVLVVSKSGEGFFSANYAGSHAKPDGKTLTVITGDRPTPRGFLGAAISLANFEPVMGLTFDPDCLVVRSKKDTHFNNVGNSQILHDLNSMNLGFSYPAEGLHYLKEALSKKSGFEIKGSFFSDTQSMLESLENNEIDAGFSPLTDILSNDPLQKQYKIIAVASPERVRELPHTPKLEELGIDLISGQWMGLGCPRGTEKDKMNQIHEILTKPDILKALVTEMKEKGQPHFLQDPKSFHNFLLHQKQALDELSFNEIHERSGDLVSLYRVSAAIALFVAFILLMPYFSYLITSFLFLIGLGIILWPTPTRSKRAVLLILSVSAGVALAVYVVFSKAFNVVFP